MKKIFKYKVDKNKLNVDGTFDFGVKYIKAYSNNRIPRKVKRALKIAMPFEYTGLMHDEGHVFRIPYVSHRIKYPPKERMLPEFNRYLKKLIKHATRTKIIEATLGKTKDHERTI